MKSPWYSPDVNIFGKGLLTVSGFSLAAPCGTPCQAGNDATATGHGLLQPLTQRQRNFN